MYHLRWHFIVLWGKLCDENKKQESVKIVIVCDNLIALQKDGVTKKNGKELEIQNRLHTGFRWN